MPRAPACPFYGDTHKERIVCLRDGVGTMGRGELRMDFPSQVCRLQYWMKHCCGDWEACSLSPALAVEYELHGDDKPSEVCHNKAKEKVKKEVKQRPRKQHSDAYDYQKWTRPSGLRKIEEYSRKGFSLNRIAKRCGCSTPTFRTWTQKCPELEEAIKRGRQSQ